MPLFLQIRAPLANADDPIGRRIFRLIYRHGRAFTECSLVCHAQAIEALSCSGFFFKPRTCRGLDRAG